MARLPESQAVAAVISATEVMISVAGVEIAVTIIAISIAFQVMIISIPIFGAVILQFLMDSHDTPAQFGDSDSKCDDSN